MDQIKMTLIFTLIPFSKLDHLDSSRLVLAGDLNVALGSLDYRGSRPIHGNGNSRKALISLIDEFN